MEEKLTLTYVRRGNFSGVIYKCKDRLYIDTEPYSYSQPSIYTISSGDDYDEPNMPVDAEFEFIPKRVILDTPYKFEYQLLSRLKMDCDYFLGNGDRYAGHLWAKTVEGQIQKMKDLYNTFPADMKPEWLTYEDILQYEREMSI